ncbi:MAG TPA: SDR family NAD(P)-dependent oxidoreductase, partial [Planctomycetota bacterium]|nr:SDR family NAD(P)-dependent oxidoreductase [Planctomycetota bacterium]
MGLPSPNLDRKVALVTGTGSGLGRAISVGMAQAGADLALTELPDRLESARETAREVEKCGRRAFVVPLDVMKLPQIHDTVDAVH